MRPNESETVPKNVIEEPQEPAESAKSVTEDEVRQVVAAGTREPKRKKSPTLDLARQMGRELTEEESEIASLTELPKEQQARLQAIDAKTLEILGKYENLTRSTRFSRFLVSLKKGIVAGAITTTVRTILRAIPGVHFFAGTITGAVFGAAYGAWRSHEVKAKGFFDVDAITEHYQTLRNEQGNVAALAFLQSTLEGRDKKFGFSREQGFRGDLSGLLTLLTTYRNDARALGEDRGGVDRAFLRFLSSGGKNIREKYRRSIAKACWEGWGKAAGKGALIGGGVGAISDVVSWFIGNLRAEHAREQYMESQTGPDQTTSFQHADKTNDWLTDQQKMFFENGFSRQTDFGNDLSKAMLEHLKYNPENLPDDLKAQYYEWIRSGEDSNQFFENIAHAFKFATPLPEHGYLYHGREMHFNNRALDWILENTYKNYDISDSSVAPPESFFDSLRNADRLLTVDFPQQLSHEAAQAGAVAAANASPYEDAAHGFGIALGTMGQINKRIKAEGGRSGGGSTGGGSRRPEAGGEQEGAGDGTANNGEDTEREEEEAETPPNGAPSPAENEYVLPARERVEIDTSLLIHWHELISEQDEFKETANSVIDDITDEGSEWADLDTNLKLNFFQLCTIAMNSELHFLIKFHNNQNGKDYRITAAPTFDHPTVVLKYSKKGEEGETISIDLNDSDSRSSLSPYTIELIRRRR